MKAIALVTESVMQSDIRPLLESECDRAGISLEFHCVTHSCSEVSRLFRAHRNIILWNCRLSHRWTEQYNRNVLYVENSLLRQSAGIFIDRRGFFSHSNLCVKRTWDQKHDVCLDDFTRKHFGWAALSGGDPDGPILACLQNRADCNLNFEFPLAESADDKVGAFIDILHEYLPDNRRVIIRPHPRFIDTWEEGRPNYRLRPEWEIDWNSDLYKLVPTCCAMITVNSTCASEAVTLGIPVITLGMGAFSGSDATMECFHDPRLVCAMLKFRPDLDRCRRYSEAILGRHFMSYSNPDPRNQELQAWLRSAF